MSMQEQLNFCFPLRTLANERVKLVAFEVNPLHVLPNYRLRNSFNPISTDAH